MKGNASKETHTCTHTLPQNGFDVVDKRELMESNPSKRINETNKINWKNVLPMLALWRCALRRNKTKNIYGDSQCFAATLWFLFLHCDIPMCFVCKIF